MGHSPLDGLFLPRAAPARAKQRGQALVLSLFAALLVVLALFTMFNMGEQSVEKIRLQNTADAAAYSASIAEARDYNFSAYTNRAMVANQVAVAQFVGLTSWFRMLSAFGKGQPDNWGRDYYDVFFDVADSPLSRLYKKLLNNGFGKVFGVFDDGKGGAKFMGVGINTFDTLIYVYGQMQKYYHYGTALTVAETLGKGFDDLGDELKDLTGITWFSNLNIPIDGDSDIIKANDKDAKLSTLLGTGGMIYHFIEWFKFTETKDPNTYGQDGQDATRFAEVAMNSLDVFSRDRSTKPAWGIDMFYAPVMTFIDPTMLIPDPGSAGPLFLPVIHRGGTELKVIDGGGSGGGATVDGGTDKTSAKTDCHGNPVSTTAYMFDSYTELEAGTDPAKLCQWDTGIVGPVGPPTAPQRGPAAGDAVYVWTGTAWVDQSTISNTIRPAPGNPPADSTLPAGQSTSTAANSRAKTVWTAMDASSFAGLDLVWVLILVVPIPLPIPFAPPWLPVAYGAAQAGHDPNSSANGLGTPTVLATDNNFSTASDDAYGKAASSWMTTLAAGLAQRNGAGTTLDSSGGLTKYRDVTDLSPDGSSVGPPLLIEVEKPMSAVPSSPGTGRFALDTGAPQTYSLSLAGVFKAITSLGGLPTDDKYMRALSKSEVYFSRPTAAADTTAKQFARASAKPNQAEYASLYNPYWQARLAPNTFWEQMISMEMHTVGM